MKKILIVDDEQRMVDLISLYLKPYNFEIVKSYSGNQAIEIIKKEKIHLVLLDVMMPDIDGWETIKLIREWLQVPIIMLTARNEKMDIVKGLRLGADDYITKPFDEEVLLARIEAVLRRSQQENEEDYGIEGLIIEKKRHYISYNNQSIILTPKEFEMIYLLIKFPRRVFNREQLIEIIWGMESETEGRTIDSHVRNIREKFRKAGFPIDNYFKTVWGLGYKWENN
ncbi:MAG: response regulator transcription factor [Bacillota bacterium]|jgi:DNA-binding response OmpR family regulator|uniref:response regulator transcription factor n=1 Tax=Fictibacillus TaxID=1329200 RepID=UPI0018CE6DDC|nr:MULTISPECIES: response regulator transcription factor [unclassified Fictibacillus]MBH0157194.1 response regulator transcription factor [Fictibacillus sp. 5RED26]MBH0159515.1 response regulator transcription factor [Fictibacillus sp. 26RED30]MBH0163685.1 response regulator transcription factor [Fictibacillus sp. 7GRE50]MBH0169688.1 response regulator transcription factor [Fictibacillus sp. 18YEL24]MBH0174188.1 response regulator transcription factor [Fictibacillus sp. 23RED33]